MTDTPDPDFCLPLPRHGGDEFAEDLDARVGSHIKQAEQAMMTAKTAALRPLELTVPQYAVLMSLHYVPGQSSAQLARGIEERLGQAFSASERRQPRALLQRATSTLRGEAPEVQPHG